VNDATLPTMPDGPPAVVVDQLGKRFRIPQERSHTLKERALHPFRRSRVDDFEVLRDVSFTVTQGEFFGVVGRNGSGKSTLLKCLAGIYRADTGSIHVDGRMSTFIELGVGFNPDLAAYDNVITNAIMLGLPAREAAARFDRVIEFAELEEFVDLKIKNYSSGMLVRLAFSVAIEAEADILLIDEVLAVGDASFQQKCFDVLNRLRAEGRTILFVTHDMGMVERFCDRALLLEKGDVVEIGPPHDVARHYLDLNFQNEKPVEQRRGDAGDEEQAATVESLEVMDPRGSATSTIHHGDHSTMRARVCFHEPVEDPIFGIVWVNEQQQNVWAASNVLRGRETGEFAAGDVAEIEVEFDVALAPGRYELSMTVTRPGMGGLICARAERAASVLVLHQAPTGGLVDLPFEMRVTRHAAARSVSTTS
jgi:ABC-type polysaccharide/polyol phosphate transport system ATPase subunit